MMKLSLRLLVTAAILSLLLPSHFFSGVVEASAVGNTYAERVTELTHTGDTNWTDVVTIASSSFVGNGVYFIVVAGDFGNTSTAAPVSEIRLVHGTTPTAFTGSFHTFEAMGGSLANQYLYGPYLTEFTQPATAEDVKVQMRVNNGAETVRATSVTIWALRQDVDLTEDSDYKYAESATTTQHTTSMVDRASITFTPTDNNHDWLVIGYQQTLIDGTGSNFEVQIDRDSGSETAGLFSREGEDDEEQMVLGTFWPFTLDNTEHTFAIQSRDDGGVGVHDHNNSSILALRLNVFEDYITTSTTATIDEFGNDTWGEIGWMDITTQTAGNIVLMARASTGEFDTPDESNIRIQIGGTSTLGDKDADWSTTSVDPTDQSPQFTLARESVAAASLDVDIDGKMHEGTAGQQDMHERAGVVFSMELAAGAEPPAAPTERRRPTLITEGSFRHYQMGA